MVHWLLQAHKNILKIFDFLKMRFKIKIQKLNCFTSVIQTRIPAEWLLSVFQLCENILSPINIYFFCIIMMHFLRTFLAMVMWWSTGSCPFSGGNISKWQEATTRLYNEKIFTNQLSKIDTPEPDIWRNHLSIWYVSVLSILRCDRVLCAVPMPI